MFVPLSMHLTDEQWALIEALIPVPDRRANGRGRPRREARDVLNGILWVMRTGAPWKDLPPRYPPYQTCHRRFQEWVANDTFETILATLAKDLRDRGGIHLNEGLIDGTFAGAKKGGPASGKRSAGRGPRSWQLQTALVFLSPYMSQVRRRTK